MIVCSAVLCGVVPDDRNLIRVVSMSRGNFRWNAVMYAKQESCHLSTEISVLSRYIQIKLPRWYEGGCISILPV